MVKNKNVILIDDFQLETDESGDWSVNWLKPGLFTIKGWYESKPFNASVFRDSIFYYVNVNGKSFTVKPKPQSNFTGQEVVNIDESRILSPMTGVVKDILVKKNEEVVSGQLLLRIESMKLVLSVNSPSDGIIKEIRIKPGQKISAGDFIIEILAYVNE